MGNLNTSILTSARQVLQAGLDCGVFDDAPAFRKDARRVLKDEARADNDWTVILEYPNDGNDNGTYMALVRAHGPGMAVKRARAEMRRVNEMTAREWPDKELLPVLVTRGHIEDDSGAFRC